MVWGVLPLANRTRLCHDASMSRKKRPLAAALLTGAVLLPLVGCETGSMSSDCSMVMNSVECRLEISGSSRHDLPYPVDSADGSEKPNSQREDWITLEETTAGESATLTINDDQYTCEQGGDFTVVSTVFTCAEIGEESIVLDLVRP